MVRDTPPSHAGAIFKRLTAPIAKPHAAFSRRAACEAAASTASNEANNDAGAAKAALEDGIKAGRARLTGLRGELAQRIPGDDARWYAFGFERPDDPETPEKPENLVLTANAGGNLFADWDNARRAQSYRASVFNTLTGAKLQERMAQDSDANFSGLPTGTPLRVEVTAINDAGESPAVSWTINL